MARGLKLGLGITSALIGLMLSLAGLGLLALVGFDGRFTTPSASARTDAHAIVFDAIFIEGDLPVSGSFATTLRVDVHATNGEVFIGVGDSGDVDRYLEGAAIAEANELRWPGGRLDTTERPGSEQPAPPDSEDFWVASDAGDGERTIEWTLDRGNWTLVVMNADAAAGVDVEGTATVDLPFLGTAMIILLAIGLPALMVGVVLIVSALRQPAAPPATGAATGHPAASPASTPVGNAPAATPTDATPPPRPDA